MARNYGDADQGAKVVALLSSRDQPATPSLLATIEDHWRELRSATGGLPRRADLDAGRIAGALPHALILEQAAPGVARIRIPGRSVVGVAG
jgi:hypothetical protein